MTESHSTRNEHQAGESGRSASLKGGGFAIPLLVVGMSLLATVAVAMVAGAMAVVVIPEVLGATLLLVRAIANTGKREADTGCPPS